MPDKRPIENFRFGLEWLPKLAEVMQEYPWSDDAFSMADPATVCKKCGRAPASVNHNVEMGVSAHDFEPSPPFTETQVRSARAEWRLRNTNLPTEEALKAWERIHEKSMRRLKKLFAVCGDIRTRDDIEKLGCTGCASFGVDHVDIKFLRLALAGSGVGLPCFVPENRYCLVHEVSGGLQKGQEQRHTEFIDKVTRPLTSEEIAHDKLVSAARQSEREHGAHSLLHGHTLPRGWEEAASELLHDTEIDPGDGVGGAQMESIPEIAEKIRAEGGIDDVVATGRTSPGPDAPARRFIDAGPLTPSSWKCNEHDKTNWVCRYCVAQAVVEGALVPDYVVTVVGGGEVSAPPGPSHLAGGDVDRFVEQMEESRMSRVIVYACVATFTQKLSRD